MILPVVGFLFVLAIWGVIFQNWRRGVVLLLTYLPFAGVVSVALYPSPFPVLYKDFFFVIPAYLAYFFSRKIDSAKQHIPNPVVTAMLALAAMVMVQSFNPELQNLLVAAIGAKVWLFYLPLIFLAFAQVKSREDLVRLLRLMVAIGWIPCVIGIAEWLASIRFGYVETMVAIYGAAAEAVTQSFAQFDLGGELFRIPSTFTFATQYFGFTLSMIVLSYVLMNLDTSRRWRKFGSAVMLLSILASFMSGVRAAYVFVPLLLALIYLIQGKFIGLAKISIVAPLVLLGALYLTGIDPFKLYDLMQELTGRYSDEIVKQGLLDAIEMAPFGTGTGMNTGPARYAFENPDSFIGIENYYAKAVVELGIIGLVVVVALFAALIWQGYRNHRRLRDPGLRSGSAAFLAFLITMTINSLKGWQIDLDPINVYFWIFSGFMFKLRFLDDSEYALVPDMKSVHQLPGGLSHLP